MTYKNGDDVVGMVTVEHSADATAPEVPAKEGYTGVWDADGTNITADTTINAVYTIKTYTVTYKNGDDVVGTVTVEHGADATAPEVPAKEGYTGAWDKDGKNITVDTTINAVYTIKEYTITFMDENGVYKVLTVKHCETIEMPAVPTKDGYVVTWDKTVDVATGDMTINAVYTEVPSSTPDETEPETEPETETDDSKESDSPETGDNNNLWLWFVLLIVSMGSALGLIFCAFKKNGLIGK